MLVFAITDPRTTPDHPLGGAIERRSTPRLHAAVLIRSDVRPEVSRATVDVSPGPEAPAAAIDEQRGGGSWPAVRVEVYSPDVIWATARNAAQHHVVDRSCRDAAYVVRILDETDDVVREERSFPPL
jgi:hypothetical protein